MTNYLKNLLFFFCYVFLLTETNLVGSVPNAGPISWNPDVLIVEDVRGGRPQQTPKTLDVGVIDRLKGRKAGHQLQINREN